MGVAGASREWLGLLGPYEDKCTKHEGERKWGKMSYRVLPQEYSGFLNKSHYL